MTDTAPKNSVVIDREMPHPPEKIWRALTQGPSLEEWLLPNDFQPVVGHRFNFHANPVPGWDGLIDAEVLVVEPNARLSYVWAAMGSNTVVAWTLTPTENGTQVRMEHSGFRSEADANFKGATNGWQKFIGNLDNILKRLD